MKLVNKFTVWYLCIAFCCTLIGSYMTYTNIRGRIDDASVNRLLAVNTAAADRIAKGEAGTTFLLDGSQVMVAEVSDGDKGEQEVKKEKKTAESTGSEECLLSVSSVYKIDGKQYRITSVDYVVGGEQILKGLEYSAIGKWVLILALIAASAQLASRIILGSFNKTMKAIGAFSVREKKKIMLPKTSTREFQELNTFVQAMTDKALEDYSSLKEFTENASHELQTPVAVISGKVELLAQSGLSDHQAELLTGIQDSLRKLSGINSSLIFLAKLENHEFHSREPLRFCRVINETLASYKELIELKSISLEKRVEKQVWLRLHPNLAQLLMNNLVSNAIRHNNEERRIEVTLTRSRLVICNTGRKPEVPTSELFHRFKKGNQSSQSVGIGLAIVKQICELNNIAVSYLYETGWHRITLDFHAEEVHPEASGVSPEAAVAVTLNVV